MLTLLICDFSDLLPILQWFWKPVAEDGYELAIATYLPFSPLLIRHFIIVNSVHDPLMYIRCVYACLAVMGGKDKLCLWFIGFHFRRRQLFTYWRRLHIHWISWTLSWMHWLEGTLSCLLWGGDEYSLHVEITVKCISQKSYSWVEVMWTEVI